MDKKTTEELFAEVIDSPMERRKDLAYANQPGAGMHFYKKSQKYTDK